MKPFANMAQQESPDPSKLTAPGQRARKCLLGTGIVCGLQVYIDKNCAVHISKGVAVTFKGHFVRQKKDMAFHYYHHPYPQANRFLKGLPNANVAKNIQVYELLETKVEGARALAPQTVRELTTNTFLEDKVLVLYLEEKNQGGRMPGGKYELKHLVISEKDVLKILQLEDELKEVIGQKVYSAKPSLIGGAKNRYAFNEEDYDRAMRPHLLLKDIHIQRFAYSELALVDTDKPVDYDNIKECFWDSVMKYSFIYEEYRGIITDAIDEITEALEYLYDQAGFYSLLTHKEGNYFNPYIQILQEKWTEFIKMPRYPVYIQYFYDWVKDLQKCYYELRAEIESLVNACCKSNSFPRIVLLGKVKGGASDYQPSPFRQHFVQPPVYNGNAKRLQKIKLIHWRLMMMIRTFDLPHLRMDETVLAAYFPPTVEEEDSTNEIETEAGKNIGWTERFAVVKTRLTPSVHHCQPLGNLAIPYYYPLSADNIYSVHHFWDFTKTLYRRTDQHLSYNASAEGYTRREEVLRPFTYPVECLPFLRAEGHIGKNIKDVLDMLRIWKRKYNLTFDVAAVGIKDLIVESNCDYLLGMEHIGGVFQGGSLVLIYQEESELIEGTIECSKEDRAIVPGCTVLADFSLPYRLSCCLPQELKELWFNPDFNCTPIEFVEEKRSVAKPKKEILAKKTPAPVKKKAEPRKSPAPKKKTVRKPAASSKPVKAKKAAATKKTSTRKTTGRKPPVKPIGKK